MLLLGPSGSGKTTLAVGLAAELAAQGRRTSCLAADPGSPAFGVPGAVCLGDWLEGAWSLRALEALCTLDAARFRLPLAAAVAVLAREAGGGTLLVDAPGVVRGVAGAELLDALVQAAAIDLVLVLHRPGQPMPLANELQCLGLDVVRVRPAEEARAPGQAARARGRTRLWGIHLTHAEEHRVPFAGLRLVGTPPRQAPEAWQGKQVAFLDRGRTCALGEVVGAEGEALRVRLPAGQGPTATLLVRDACRGSDGLLNTGRPFAFEVVHYCPPPDVLPDERAAASTGPRPVVQMETAVAGLVNGVFGDPLLHLRLRISDAACSSTWGRARACPPVSPTRSPTASSATAMRTTSAACCGCCAPGSARPGSAGSMARRGWPGTSRGSSPASCGIASLIGDRSSRWRSCTAGACAATDSRPA